MVKSICESMYIYICRCTNINRLYNFFMKNILYARWFRVTFWSPSWRSLNLWKDHLTIPKRAHRLDRCMCWKLIELKTQEFVWKLVLQCPSNPNSHLKVRQPGQETWSTDDNSRPPNSWQPGRKLNKARFGNGTSLKLELYKVTKIFEDSEPLTFPYLLPKNHKTSLPFLGSSSKFGCKVQVTPNCYCDTNMSIKLSFSGVISWKWTCIYLYKAIVGPNPFNFFRIFPRICPQKKNWSRLLWTKCACLGANLPSAWREKSALQPLDP